MQRRFSLLFTSFVCFFFFSLFFSSYFFFFCSFNFLFYSIALFCFVRKNKQKTHRTWKDDQAEISELTFHVVSMEFHSSRKKKITIILQGIIFMLIGMGINVSRQWLRTSWGISFVDTNRLFVCIWGGVSLRGVCWRRWTIANEFTRTFPSWFSSLNCAFLFVFREDLETKLANRAI